MNFLTDEDLTEKQLRRLKEHKYSAQVNGLYYILYNNSVF